MRAIIAVFLSVYFVFVCMEQQSHYEAAKNTIHHNARRRKDDVTQTRFTAKGFQACWTHSVIIKKKNDYFDVRREHINEPAYRLIGITPSCFVYYGWLHQLYSSQISNPLEFRSNYNGVCKDFKPFLIKTEGKKTLLFIVAKRQGRRILVQNVARNTVISSSSRTSVMWISFNPFARHEQFLSNQFPREFVFQMLQNLEDRIYILGYSRSWTVILELKIYVDKNDNLIPFITRKVLTVSPIAHAPLYSSAIIPAYDFLHGNNTVSGFIFVRQIYKGGKPVHGSYVAFGIPMISLHLQSFTGSCKIRDYDGYLHRNDHFTAYSDRLCPTIGNYMIYPDYSYTNWTAKELSSPELTLLMMSRRRWFNPLRFHRRMSYPHTFHRAQRQRMFRNWTKALPAVLLNCGLMAAILYSMEYFLHLIEKMKASKKGLNQSQSANSF